MTTWIRKWDVTGSRGDIYIVSLDAEGKYGCSCPVWKYQRKECKHILEVKRTLPKNTETQVVVPLKKETPAPVIEWGTEKNVWF